MDITLIKGELFRNFSKTLFNILIIAISVTIIIAFNTLTYSYKMSTTLPFRNLGVNLVVQKKMNKQPKINKTMEGIRLPFSNALFESGEFEKIKKIDGVELISKSLLIWEMSKGKFKTILGINTEDPNIGANQIKNWITKGHFPKNVDEIALEKHYAKFNNLKEGNTINIERQKLNVSGLIEIKEGSQLSMANAYVTLQKAQIFLNVKDAVNIFYITLNDYGKLEKVEKKILAVIPQAVISSSNSILESAGSMVKITDKFSLVGTIAIVVFAGILILKVMFSAIDERTREIGILKAIGWNNNEIKKELIVESIIQNLIGNILGIIFSIFICWCISFITIDVSLLGQTPPDTAIQYLPHSNNTLQFVILPELYLLVFGGSIIIGILSGYLFSRKLLIVRPAEVLRKI